MCQKIWSEALDEASADVYAPWNSTREEAYLIKDLNAKGWRKPEWKPMELLQETDAKTWGATTEFDMKTLKKYMCQDRPRHSGVRIHISPRVLCHYADGYALVEWHLKELDENDKDSVQRRNDESAWPYLMTEEVASAHGQVMKACKGLMSYKTK